MGLVDSIRYLFAGWLCRYKIEFYCVPRLLDVYVFIMGVISPCYLDIGQKLCVCEFFYYFNFIYTQEGLPATDKECTFVVYIKVLGGGSNKIIHTKERICHFYIE